MTWFSKERVAPAQLGLRWSAAVQDQILSSGPTTSLRDLLAAEGAPVHKRATFDDGVRLLALFVAFVAVRRHYPLPTAEQVLAGALRPVLASCGEHEAGALRTRLDRYRELCRWSENRGRELATLTHCACVDLFIDDASDPASMMSLTGWLIMTSWITTYLTMFEDLLSKTVIAA